jgi:hypothetical protein
MTRELTPAERLDNQVTLGQCRIGNEAARAIARRVTDEHGFWDYEERKLAQQSQPARSVLTVIHGERQPEDLAA